MTRPPTRLRVAVTALAVALALVGASCSSAGPSSGAGSASGPTASDGAATDGRGSGSAVPVPKLSWHDCDGGYQCATLHLPLDYAHPAGRTLAIGVVRKPAADRSRRIGALFVNPGGPGVSAIDFLEGYGFDPELEQRFDLVAVDPRGVGRSTAVDCDTAPAELYSADPSPDSPAEVDHYLQVSQAYVDRCRQRNGDLLDHVGTRDTARDMDEVRQAMGDRALNYLGFSYGTALGQAYLGLFPTRVRAMVLDGVVDLSLDGPALAEQQADGFQLALTHFADDCTRQGSSCPVAPDPLAVLHRVEASVERAPLPSASADRPAGPGELDLALADALYSRSSWPKLARALAQADGGDGSGLVDLADDYLDVTRTSEKNTEVDGYFAIGCVDQRWPRDPAAVLADGKAADASAPDFGSAIVNDYLRCAIWPGKADPLVPPKAPGSPPVLVVGTTGDPATPYQASVDVARQLPKGRLITYVGDGHTAYGTSSCVSKAVDTYLLTRKLPDTGTRCTR